MDHCDVKKRETNPRESANIFSLITFAYSTDLIKKGRKKYLEEEDLYEVVANCESKFCGDRLEKEWRKEYQSERDPSLFKALYNVFGWRYFLWGFTQAACEIFNRVVAPNALADLVAYFQPGQTVHTKYDAYCYVAIILLSDFSKKVFFYNYDLFLNTVSIEVRIALCSVLFRKLLRISPTAVSKSHLGNVVTLITKDVQQVKRSIFVFNDLWVFGSVVLVTCYLLYSRMGTVSLIAIILYLCVAPLQVLLGKILNKLRKDTCSSTDDRLEFTKEVLSASKIIKMYTWEKYFYNKINVSRKKEIAKVVLVFYLRMIIMLLGTILSKVGFYLLIIGYIWMQQPPDSSIVFFIAAHFSSLRIFFGYLFPDSIGKIAELSATITRIKQVLVTEELPNKSNKIRDLNIKPCIELINVVVKIGDYYILSNVNFKADSGLTLVTGTVGCGKSMLLKTILREYTLSNGDIKFNGTISYASQEPWCFPSTIKQNILFGEPFDEKRYREVLKVCALEYDLSIFENGDETILTDRGQNLSKGQQARINLARTIYKDSDIYLLDDCLSSLDAHVHHFIFNRCIKRFLNGKICILVTQAENILREANAVYVMQKGEIAYRYIPKQNSTSVIKHISESIEQTNEFLSNERAGFESTTEVEKLLETEQTTYKNIYEEVLQKGAVSRSIYKKYIIYGGGIFLLSIVLTLVGLKQAVDSYSEKLLSVWSDEKKNILNIKANVTKGNGTLQITNLHNAEHQAYSTFRTYTIMLIASIFLEFVKTYSFLDFCRRASVNIHKAMIWNVLQAVLTFFDTHFIGNVLNRFSQDVINVDENLPFQLLEFLDNVVRVCGAVTLLVLVNPYFSTYIIITFGILIAMLNLYLPVARNLQRLEASTRSPMVGHLNAALEGITTIRAFKAEKMIVNEYERHQNTFTSAHYTLLYFQYAFGFFMSMLTSMMVLTVVCSCILFDAGATAGTIGLALTQVIDLGGVIKESVSSWANLENLMTATERALEYTGLKTESKQGTIPKHWSDEGIISYENVSLSYNNSQVILNNLSFDIGSKQKVGIVGRTGAGKSSIISTIFRLYEVQGKITINGVDIKTLPLNYLRKHLAVIPQDPILFSGTIRANLDPFGKFADEDLWTALEKSNLKSYISSLYTEISNNCSNFSSGQKQMICVARAILNKSKIVILDEATANMDNETEILIHDTIKSNFFDCTVLIIAHRLQSISDCDRVMVLDRGEIKEFDDPKILFQKKDALLYKMIQQSDC